MPRRFVRLIMSLLAGLTLALATAAHARHDGATLSGQVTDTDGRPLEGVTVTVNGRQSTETDAGGMYLLNGIRQREQVLVDFTKAGYAPTQGTVPLVVWTTVERDDERDHRRRHFGSFWGHHRHPKRERQELSAATLNKAMLKSGTPQTIDAATGGELAEGGFKVTIPPNGLTVGGSVDVVISPMDVSTEQIAAAPGDFSARTARGREVMLESFSMADFTLTQNGAPVNLRPGVTADIELLLPENTPLVPGEVKPLWYFDTRRGLWQEEGTGVVGQSTTDPERLAVFASVRHFTYWNCDQPLTSTAIAGRVVDTAGNPIAGARIENHGIDYAGQSSAVTDAGGNYCILVKTSSNSRLTASARLVDGLMSSASQEITSGGTVSNCSSGTAQVVPDLVLNTSAACVTGDLRDGAGQPVADAVVYSSAGSHTTTDADGVYQLAVPELSTVRIYTADYPAAMVTSPAAGAPCAVLPLRPGTGGGDVACISGVAYQCTPDNPYPGLEFRIRDEYGEIIGSSITDGAGAFCIDGLPPNTDVMLEYIWREGEPISTGAAGGSCATNSCNTHVSQNVRCW